MVDRVTRPHVHVESLTNVIEHHEQGDDPTKDVEGSDSLGGTAHGSTWEG